MRRYERVLASVLFSLLLIAGSASASYWFQVGARGGLGSNTNGGASVQIETVLPQSLGLGTMGFWTGETLSNGAFLQVGYVVENQSGEYPINCTISGCSGSEYLSANDAEWFYEYFPSGENTKFLGSIGPDGSAGTNGKFNTYSFYSLGNVWYFQFNNKTVGSANLGASDSGPYYPLAMGELANATNASVPMNRVIFTNLSAYKYDMYLPVSEAFGTMGYGVGSSKFLRNPYGVEEIGNRVNYFEVGSGLPQYTNNTRLWSLGYRLSVISKYGNLSSGNSYTAYSSVRISSPLVVYLNNFTRANFQAWSGVGYGSYSGSSNSSTVVMDTNETETAFWQVQDFVNVTSPFGNATGTGWYANGSTAFYDVNGSTIYRNGKPRFIFSGWSNGNAKPSGSVKVDSPGNLAAEWSYTTTLFGKDAYGDVLNVPTFLIDGQRMNSTPVLDASAKHLLQVAYYKGAQISMNYTIDSNSSEVLFIPLPVYDISISTKDLFGLPVDVPVTLTYKNGTEVSTSSGPQGLIGVSDAPYGYAGVVFDNFGTSSLLVAEGGQPETVYFVSSLNIGAAVAGVALLLYLIVWRRKSKSRQQPQAKPQAQQTNAKA